MNDEVDTPKDSSRYTLTFETDGRANVLADCNRGGGSWISEASSQLRFGPMATTRAMCQPGSISDKYISQFEWVRSYVIKNGHLFLATMADGSIIEFEPIGQATAVAIVLGEDVRTSDAGEMQDFILSRLFDVYAASHDIDVEPSEIKAHLEQLQQGMAKEGLDADENLSAEETQQVAAMRREMALSMIRQWKINKALYHEYGGRIIYQQLGPEPLDAYRQFLEQRQSEGAFKIENQTLEKEFWRYFTDESIHDFMAPGSDDENGAFTIPPWE